MHSAIEPSWRAALKEEFAAPYFKQLTETVQRAYREKAIFPPSTHVFNAFALTPFDTVKVVILGQDPYHGDDQAHGLSFSVQDNVRTPPSLKNIYKELASDLGVPIPESGNLEHWATQGVLLLNATLTVESGKPGSHQKLGWERFTDAVIKKLSDKKEHVVFLLWGAYAHTKESLIDASKHLILKAPHPSPLSAYSGFFGSKPFSKTNEYLTQHGIKPIAW